MVKNISNEMIMKYGFVMDCLGNLSIYLNEVEQIANSDKVDKDSERRLDLIENQVSRLENLFLSISAGSGGGNILAS